MTSEPHTNQIAIDLFGVRVLLEGAPAELVSAVVSRLPPTASSPPGRSPARRYVVQSSDHGLAIRRDARQPMLAASVDAAAEVIVSDLQRTVAHRADGLLFVHAGAVAWQGRALVLPGRSLSGKSELVAALVRAGAEYLSDEFAVFDGHGSVHPYARPIALRQADGSRAWTSAASLGGRTVARPVPPALIAFLRFSPGSPWRPRALSPGQTVLGLLRHVVAARRRLPLARSVLVPIASTVRAVRTARGEADEVAAELLRELGSA